jgi:hypothetical protein
MGQTKIKTCPACRSTRITETESKTRKDEAVKLLCRALGVTKPSNVGQDLKRVVDLVMP